MKKIAQKRVLLFDPVKKNHKWYNTLVIFESRTNKVSLNFENTRYRWAGLDDLEKEKDSTNIFADKRAVLSFIKAHLKK